MRTTTCNPIHTGSWKSSLCLNLGNDKPLKPEIFHTLKATQNKVFQATTVNIKDFSMARYLFVQTNVSGVSENG